MTPEQLKSVTLEERDGALYVQLADGGDSFEVVAWQDSRLVLARGTEVRTVHVASDGTGVFLGMNGHTHHVPRPTRRRTSDASGHADEGALSSPMPGKISAAPMEPLSTTMSKMPSVFRSSTAKSIGSAITET